MFLNVALLQMTGGRDVTANIAKAERFCREAKKQGADIALFPELWNIGYGVAPEDEDDLIQWKNFATSTDEDYVLSFKKLAIELKMAIVVTYLERDGERLYNTATLIDRFGNSLFSYRKVHTVDDRWEVIFTPGDDYYVASLDTASGMVRVGVMICYDREFPEVARILMLKGAEIILVPNACELEENRIAQFRTRAFENMVGVAMTNYASPRQNGHSIAFDGMRVKGTKHDPLLVEAGEEEGICIAKFDLDALRKYRECEIWGNAYRKPKTYGPLLDESINSPFIRTNDRR
ncbi:MAG: hypothetical protein ACD_81C00209G0001 [uncultured bacterium]|uniref:Nitrilase/cyanide hydratase and apolipoprotein N-acyltransferase n=1 Tax=Candidatus Wolfebacteria bacterium GW2011_GWC2_39_22 TaxID=1619013 RepID=A0A0G0N944_9BACT|nr:MAG: hypothetical protein ACD_81C00209G0001 [uncultured bacterium]KKR12679.1 MAG: Nitrilase/cyanide hydratase and apolipoprotein N-acyltransferase [Candidatus Wolfebacteria bacterium GW2011_GWC2_39_22]HBI25657.1 carbon-nitrogen hydrolase family protein [Candidatus Wolfebacteria bacterium]